MSFDWRFLLPRKLIVHGASLSLSLSLISSNYSSTLSLLVLGVVKFCYQDSGYCPVTLVPSTHALVHSPFSSELS